MNTAKISSRSILITAFSGILLVACGDDDIDFGDFDTNDDDVVTLSEWQDKFDQWDINEDDVLEEDEILLNTIDVEDFDQNDDGALNEQEWEGIFRQWDEDGDGGLDDADEFED